MAVRVGSARIDERGKARGGKAGDQTGKEVSTQNWYKHAKGWVCVRPKDPAAAAKIAAAMKAACANNNIGYDQNQRLTLYNAAKAVGFDPAKVKAKVETDCSALVRVCCAFAGIMAINFTTGNQVAALRATGAFDILTASKYVNQSAYLRAGDILVTKTKGHTVVVLTDGPKAEQSYTLGGRALSRGCEGPDVTKMQEHLLALGFKLPEHGADGDFGGETLVAVKAFQAKAKLAEDGVMDADDIAKLVDVALNGWPEEPVTPDPVAPGNPMEPGAPAYPVRGIIPDISDNQRKIDLDKLSAGCDFAIFRVIQGNGKLDTQAVRNMSGCRARGFPFHAYHFLKPYSIADAEALAVKMYAACSPYGPVVYWLDIESLFPGVTHAKNRTYIQAYVAKLRALGAKKIGIYMGEYRMKKWYAPIAGIFDALWIAHWGKNTGYLSNIPRVPGLTIGLHQYTSMAGYKGVPGAPGVSTRVDLNRLTGNLPLSWFTGRKHSGVEYPGIVRITASSLNVRSGPGTGYKVLAKIPKGRYAIRRPGSVTGWQAVAYNGMNGFVSTKYIEAVGKG